MIFMKQRETHKTKRIARHRRIRARVSGTMSTPRLFVFKSNQHLYATLTDDTNGKSILSFSDATENAPKGTKIERAHAIGEMIGRAAKEKGIRSVVFDRGGYRYHGRVKAVAEGARSAGLAF
jgi:large subunit ribosomal protein L18